MHAAGHETSPVTLSETQSAHLRPSKTVNIVPALSDQFELVDGTRLEPPGCKDRDQQLDALHEQLQSLVQSSQSINESLLRVHQQIQILKSP